MSKERSREKYNGDLFFFALLPWVTVKWKVTKKFREQDRFNAKSHSRIQITRIQFLKFGGESQRILPDRHDMTRRDGGRVSGISTSTHSVRPFLLLLFLRFQCSITRDAIAGETFLSEKLIRAFLSSTPALFYFLSSLCFFPSPPRCFR